MPTISFRDIEVQERESDLVGASFGRGFFVLDDYSPLRDMSEDGLAKGAALFPVKKALQYIPLKPIDSIGKGCLGETFYLAPEPAVRRGLHLLPERRPEDRRRSPPRRRSEARQGREAGAVPRLGRAPQGRERGEAGHRPDGHGRGGPGRPADHGAGGEGPPSRRLGPALPGRLSRPQLETAEREAWERDPAGPFVVPGTFTVTLAKKVDGVLTPLAEPQTFAVESLALASLPEKDKAALLEFQKKAGELQRAMMGAGAAAEDALKNLRFIKKALLDTPGADPKLAEKARAIETRVQAELVVLYGDAAKTRRSEPAAPSLMDRVSVPLESTGPVTITAKKGYEIAANGFEKLLEDMRQTIEIDLKKLQSDLEAAGAPWTPGRGVPIWKKR